MPIIHTGSLNTLTVTLAKSTGNSGNQRTFEHFNILSRVNTTEDV